MLNRKTQIGRDYAEAIFRRSIEPLHPLNFHPDWDDHPSLYKIYEDVERLALPLEAPTGFITMADLLKRVASSQEALLKREELSLNELAMMLYFAYSVINRRLRAHPQQDGHRLALYTSGNYARSSASGGGLYPAEIYWACGAGGTVLPGLYHYDNAHHAMERLVTGDVTPSIRSAVFAEPAALNTNQFLLITMNFWKNAYKYNSFSYHVVNQDLGALLCTLWFIATGLQIDWKPIFWYQDNILNGLLDLDQDYESVFTVIPLPGEQPAFSAEVTNLNSNRSYPQALVKKDFFQRSKKVYTFELNVKTHLGTLIIDDPRPDLQKIHRANIDEVSYTGDSVLLPTPAVENLKIDLLETFQKRRSSFGSFASTPPLSSKELATILYSGAAASNYGSDVKSLHCAFTRLMVFVNNVEGIERGAYAYDAKKHCLHTIRREDLRLTLQQHYLLQNYSLADTGAVIAIVGNMENMLEVYGNRGYRLLNTEAGLVAQGIYMISAAMSVACGAALGFDNLELNKLLDLEGTEHKTFLLVFVGHEDSNIGDLDYRLV